MWAYKELLSIYMISMELSTMLLGAKLHILNDHLNITTNNTTPDCIIHCLCWEIQPLHTLYPWQRKCCYWHAILALYLDKSVLSKGEQLFFLKNSVSKGMNLADNQVFLQLLPLPVQDTI